MAVQNVNKGFVYMTDFTASLNWHVLKPGLDCGLWTMDCVMPFKFHVVTSAPVTVSTKKRYSDTTRHA